jgi:SPP1 family predicted phage head-tail adaptor
MRAGELRHRVTIQKQDDAGSAWNGTRTWNTYATVWAKISPAQGNESMDRQTEKRQAEVTHIITMRYIRGLKPSMRISFEGRYFYPEVIRNIDERNAWVEIEAREDVDA